jgi:hydrogenase maturation protease
MRYLVIGIGNPFRRDDGVGVLVAKEIAAAGRDDIEVRIESGEGGSLMELWKGAERVVIIDAVRSHSAPGKIHQIDATKQHVPSEFFHYSSHAFGVAEAIELARALGELPPAVTVVGIEGKDFSSGTELSSEVEIAARVVLASVLTLIESSK